MASSTRSQTGPSSRTNFIISFYDPASTDSDGSRQPDRRGRTLDDILAFSDRELEYHHDFIQYLFPLPERSPINPYAPLITAEVRAAFLCRPELRLELRRALARLLGFYGFEGETTSTPAESGNSENSPTSIDADLKIAKSQPNSRFRSSASMTWLKRFDHNHLRITRILRCLRILGLEGDAKEFLRALKESDENRAVGARTWSFWERACERPLYLAPDAAEDDVGVEWLKE